MKIGILATASASSGGTYQYTQSLVESLLRYSKYDYFVFRNSECKFNSSINSNSNIFNYPKNPKNKILQLKKIIFVSFSKTRAFISMSKYYDFIKKYELDLVICPTISFVPIFINKPYIVTIHDLQHKYYRNFFTLKETLSRDYTYKKAAENALLVICESNYVKKDLTRFLSIPEENIRIIPSPPQNNYISHNINNEKLEEIKNKYNLPDKFLFYPAQFWYHKNHTNLITSINLLRKKIKQETSLILIGSPQNNYENAMNKIKELEIENLVKWLGYVPGEDIPYLYKLATILVMPTLFESVSMPIWEAFYLGCPVVSSNVCALPEQVGDAGLLFDPNNVEDMAEKICQIWTDEDLRKELIQKGYERVKDLTLENYARQWEKVIGEALLIAEKRKK